MIVEVCVDVEAGFGVAREGERPAGPGCALAGSVLPETHLAVGVEVVDGSARRAGLDRRVGTAGRESRCGCKGGEEEDQRIDEI